MKNKSCWQSLAGFLSLAFLILVPPHIGAQSSLSSNVLVVYNSADASSTDVANYHISQRGTLAGNVCAITPPSITLLNWSDFNTTVKTPIRNCLNTAWAEIFYMVFAYNTPYLLVAPDGLNYSVDSL